MEDCINGATGANIKDVHIENPSSLPGQSSSIDNQIPSSRSTTTRTVTITKSNTFIDVTTLQEMDDTIISTTTTTTKPG